MDIFQSPDTTDVKWVVQASDGVLFNIAVLLGKLGSFGREVLLFILFNNATSTP
jgi:hypothetical protein